MSLIRQIWLLLLGSLLLALAASVTVNVSSARDAMQTQMRLKNSDNATALAQVLSSQHGQRELMALAIAAQFDTGFYRRIRFTGADGQVLFERAAEVATLHAPAWFVALAPIESASGIAQVSDGWRALGAIEVVSQVAYAHDELWRGSVRAALALGVVALGAGLLAWVGVARIRRPLDDTVEQAVSLQRGEYLTVAEPGAPELRRLTRAMNSMVARLRSVFEAHAAQVESLRVQANCDSLTGLSNRRHFMGQLGALLQREDGAAEGGLVLVRVLDLAGVNRALGHASADQVLRTVAQALEAYTVGGAGGLVGRLNGADFALFLPAGGVALDTSRALADLLRAALQSFDVKVALAIGAVELHRHGTPMAELLAAADMALARSEAAGPYAVEQAVDVGEALAGVGEGGWRRSLTAALENGRTQLAEFVVLDARGAVLHLECPLRVQLDPSADYASAARWLPLAGRARLTPAVDERAVVLALAAIDADGRDRAVNVASASLADSGFAARLRGHLLAAPQAARQLWIELPESAAADNFTEVAQFGRQLRPLGVRLGLEHAGEHLARIELLELGLDYVKLDASVTVGAAGEPARAGFVRGLTAMLHGLSLQVIAEGVADPADADALERCGVDAQTGSLPSARHAAAGGR